MIDSVLGCDSETEQVIKRAEIMSCQLNSAGVIEITLSMNADHVAAKSPFGFYN